MLDTVLTALMPHLLEILMGLTAAGIAWFAAEFRKRTGIEISEKAQKTVHSAIWTGVRAGLEKHGFDTDPDRVISDAVDHAIGAGAGDSVAKLGVDKFALETLARSVLTDARNLAKAS